MARTVDESLLDLARLHQHARGCRRPPEAEVLRAWALHLAARRGKPIAIVALARRLDGILYALLRDGTRFEPRRSPASVPVANV